MYVIIKNETRLSTLLAWCTSHRTDHLLLGNVNTWHSGHSRIQVTDTPGIRTSIELLLLLLHYTEAEPKW